MSEAVECGWKCDRVSGCGRLTDDQLELEEDSADQQRPWVWSIDPYLRRQTPTMALMAIIRGCVGRTSADGPKTSATSCRPKVVPCQPIGRCLPRTASMNLQHRSLDNAVDPTSAPRIKSAQSKLRSNLEGIMAKRKTIML